MIVPPEAKPREFGPMLPLQEVEVSGVEPVFAGRRVRIGVEGARWRTGTDTGRAGFHLLFPGALLRYMRYEFRTMVGTFWITQRADEAEGAILGIDQITLGSYDTAAAAAADVYSQKTGWERWDFLQEISGPRDLSEWEEVIEEA